jgi:hypothetical protein
LLDAWDGGALPHTPPKNLLKKGSLESPKPLKKGVGEI